MLLTITTKANDDLIKAIPFEMDAVADNGFPKNLKVQPNSDSYHMSPVRTIHCRAQSDEPLWDDTIQTFGSKFGNTPANIFRGAMDTVNTASVEGGLMYVQAEGINYNTRSAQQKCVRKNSMQFLVFYDVVLTQTNETLALYQSEYGPMVPMDGGRCTPVSGETMPTTCLYFNGTDGQPNLGPFVGGESKETDPRAPYPHNYWYSFPNTCPLQSWATKTDACRANTRRGLCDVDQLPDGIHCTFNYRILGYIPIDDVVGITSMTNPTTNTKYKSFAEFCQAGGVEFQATESGVWSASIDFWKKPQDPTANQNRITQMLQAYQDLVSGKLQSPQVKPEVVKKMKPIPSISDLTAQNPPCYKNIPSCGKGAGCKRDYYSQLCLPCKGNDAGCSAAPADFTFPTLALAKGDDGKTGSGSLGDTPIIGASPSATPALGPTPTPKPPSFNDSFAIPSTTVSILSTVLMLFTCMMLW